MPVPDLLDASISDLQAGLTAGHFSCVQLVKAYLARIDEVNTRGPELRAVNAVSPVALEAARLSDEEREAGRSRGMLHGIPILFKDMIPIRQEDGMSSTWGSTALLGTKVKQEAAVVRRLRDAGAIILGLCNCSQWGWGRGYGFKDNGKTLYPMGWSSVGGQGLHPYNLEGCTLGSSSGSASAAAIGLAAATIGSDRLGSIVLPAAAHNIAAIRPTPSLVSRAGLITLSPGHDSLGPMGRCVTDLAHVMQAISGVDEDDYVTKLIPGALPNFADSLDANSLKTARIGVIPEMMNMLVMTDPQYYETVFEQAIDKMRELGATVIDNIPLGPLAKAFERSEMISVSKTDVMISFKEYLATLEENPNNITSLEDVLKWNDEHPEDEKPPGCEDQAGLAVAAKADGRDSGYVSKLLTSRTIALEALRSTIETNKLDAIVFPAHLPLVTPFARASAPIVTVPMGFLPGDTKPFCRADAPSCAVEPWPHRPAGIALGGLPFTDAKLLSLAYSYEQATKHRQKRLPVAEAIPKAQIVV